ncbi:uncharacterized protein LOC142353498 [Convolutriloba macropyga]|uniref:uncharacterized protein LOC142353498 n=1 Tax=Convolutriloba macropyga TaxID=536237 RepID=UPI003F526A7A
MIVLESPSKIMAAQLANCSIDDNPVSDANESTSFGPTPELSSADSQRLKNPFVKSPVKRERPNTRSKVKTNADIQTTNSNEQRKIFPRGQIVSDSLQSATTTKNQVKISPKKKTKSSEACRDVNSDTSTSNSSVISKKLTFDSISNIPETENGQQNLHSLSSESSSKIVEADIKVSSQIEAKQFIETKSDDFCKISTNASFESEVIEQANILPDDKGTEKWELKTEKVPNEMYQNLAKKLTNKPRRSQSVDASPFTKAKNIPLDVAPKDSTKPKKPRSKKTTKRATSQENLKNSNFKVTDFYEYRRSNRRLYEKLPTQEEIYTKCVLEKCQDGLKVENFEGKGRGIVATKTFERNDFVVEYRGDLILPSEAKERELEFESNPEVGCYMYYFVLGNTRYCIDATKEKESFGYGRLLNHSRKRANCRTKAIWVKSEPKLILVANRTINEGEELLYDYGDRSKTALENHPWLSQ